MGEFVVFGCVRPTNNGYGAGSPEADARSYCLGVEELCRLVTGGSVYIHRGGSGSGRYQGTPDYTGQLTREQEAAFLSILRARGVSVPVYNEAFALERPTVIVVQGYGTFLIIPPPPRQPQAV